MRDQGTIRIQASSEAMTHFMIYSVDPEINAVVHVHSPSMWNSWMDREGLPGTDVTSGRSGPAARSTLCRFVKSNYLGVRIKAHQGL